MVLLLTVLTQPCSCKSGSKAVSQFLEGAKQENKTPEQISEFYHNEFCEVFRKLGFSYDLYTKTTDKKHKAFVTDFHKTLYESKSVEERTVKQAYCPTCQQVLTDRLVAGTCPVCGKSARGDQCDACGEIFDADSLINAKCSECDTPIVFNETTQIFLLISKLKNELNGCVMVGVGGSFDVFSGIVKESPKIYQKLGLEWLYRTILQPERFRRIFPVLPIFLIKCIMNSIFKKG